MDDLRGVMAVAATAGLYVFGLFVLVRTRRWSLVARPLPLGLSAALLAGFLAITLVNETGTGGGIALVAVGVLFAAGALPAVAGVYAWLKQGSALRLHGAEQLLAGHFRSPAVASSLAVGLAGGAAMAVVTLAHAAAGLSSQGFGPSVARELTLASPTFYGSMLAWVAGAAGVALGVAVLYELPVRLVKRPWPLIAFLAVLTGALAGGGQPIWLSVMGATLIVAILLAVYAWNGLAATAVTVWVCFLLLDLAAARSIGGPMAGSRGTFLLVTLVALVAVTAWAFGGERAKAHAANLSSRSGIR